MTSSRLVLLTVAEIKLRNLHIPLSRGRIVLKASANQTSDLFGAHQLNIQYSAKVLGSPFSVRKNSKI